MMLHTTPERSQLMSRVRQKNTHAELAVKKLLRKCNISFSTKSRYLPGRPDIVNQKEMWAIFVHGCFWHGHDCAHGGIKPKTNVSYWSQKISANKVRDRNKRNELVNLGYSVLEVWECEIKKSKDLDERLKKFIFLARQKLEIFRLESDKGFVTRIVRVDVYRKRSQRLHTNTTTLGTFRRDTRDIFDKHWLQSHTTLPLVRTTEERLSVADLFCGCGGLSLGVREACLASGRQFRSILAVDNDSTAMAVYNRNFSPRIQTIDPIETIFSGRLGAEETVKERKFLKSLEKIDLVIAGPPCQGHSNLNNHTRREDDRNRLYLRVIRFAELVKPKYILIENVPAVIHDKGLALYKGRRHLEKLGYNCDEATVDLWKIGIPQIRKRHVLVATLKKKFIIQDVIDAHALELPRTVGWAIGDLQDVVNETHIDKSRVLSRENGERIRWLFEHDAYDLPNKKRPICHRDGHTYYAMYGRLRLDRPANTVTTGFGSPGQGRYIHPTRQRTLTAHEAARLQFFPDFFDFSPATTYRALARMIGNAVPMKLSYLLTLALLTSEGEGAPQ